MDPIIQKISNMGMSLPKTAKTFGAYQPAILVDNWVYVSGQLPVENGEILYKGRLGENVEIEEGKKAAALCFLNCLAAVTGLDINLEKISQVVKLTGHVCCTADFSQQPQVLNGASELCHQIFGQKGIHSRAALGAYSLPMGVQVELEAIFKL